MAAETFKVVDINPNESAGGGGCLCSETKNSDTSGPFAVFYSTDMENTISPVPVLCLGCAEAFCQRADTEDVLVGGEAGAPRTDVQLKPKKLGLFRRDEDKIPEV